MNDPGITAEVRRLVMLRAGGVCEYCLISSSAFRVAFHVDHVIARKHEDPALDHNLCLSCPECNRAKGSDISTIVDGMMVRLFNPRIDAWRDHFALDGAVIRARSKIGRGTIRLLGINDPFRVDYRHAAFLAGIYPDAHGKRIMSHSP